MASCSEEEDLDWSFFEASDAEFRVNRIVYDQYTYDTLMYENQRLTERHTYIMDQLFDKIEYTYVGENVSIVTLARFTPNGPFNTVLDSTYLQISNGKVISKVFVNSSGIFAQRTSYGYEADKLKSVKTEIWSPNGWDVVSYLEQFFNGNGRTLSK
jgi:hypothetical protein